MLTAVQAIHQPNLGRKGLETIFTTASYVHGTFEEVGRSIAGKQNKIFKQKKNGLQLVSILASSTDCSDSTIRLLLLLRL